MQYLNEPVVTVMGIDDNGEPHTWSVPIPFIEPGSEVCQLCPPNSHTDPASALVGDGSIAAWWCCDQCNILVCLQHAYWWQYGHSGSRIICATCRDRLREIDQKLIEEGDADEDMGTLIHCASGSKQPMRKVF